MLKQSQSGHPGGSLSMLDFLATLYVFRLTQTEEKIVISNGHVSPAVYSILAECGAADKADIIKHFRQFGSKFEGHVTRHIPGIYFGTGPLGVGISAATGFAMSEKLKHPSPNGRGDGGEGIRQVFCTIGDGEMQEGQMHEAALFAAKEKLSNLTVFVDYNRVQISGTLDATMPIDVVEFFKSKNWKVVEVDGHDYEQLWAALHSQCKKGRPLAIIGKTVMGHGVPGMEEDGKALLSKWHGNAPKPEMADEILSQLKITNDELQVLEAFRKDRAFKPQKNRVVENLCKNKLINTGEPKLYSKEMITDCRSAYGDALADIISKNKNVVAMAADLSESVKTSTAQKIRPDQYIECGIMEQHMVSCAGGMSLYGYIPFASTFGAFLTSRAKDQGRVNDINQTNVKMVATHCGLSVGEDGPTHQSIDDMGIMMGHLNTNICEPADPNHCDRIIRYVAGHDGNFYVRMGRAKLATLLDEKGNVFFDTDYPYKYGKCDLFRSGSKVTIVATGPMVHEALKARESYSKPEAVEIVIVSSIKRFDDTLLKSLKKTGRVITVEDHNPYNGLAASLSRYILENGIAIQSFASLGVREYQLSGKPEDLYHNAKIDSDAVLEKLNGIV
jgi:transketolase